MLKAAGLDVTEERAYRLLVRSPGAHAAELAAELSVPVDSAHAALRSLHAKGLARPLDEDRFAPVAPDIAIGPVLLREQEGLDQARQAVDQLTGEYLSHARRHDPGQVVEVLPSRSALRQQLRLLQDNARHEVVYFCRAGHVAMPSEENAEEPAALRRGVRYRVIYERALLEQPGMPASLAHGIGLGEQARAVPELPVRMAIADGELGVLPLVQHVNAGAEPTAALVRRGSLLDALTALFESQWERATPLAITESGEVATSGCPLDSDSLSLLSLLVAGVPDKSIATQLQVSHRTVQRRITQLMEQAGARTRTQLAWHAARENWL
ncbi:helix-turn-helix domain-containing protein [Nonomuraea sp. NPDC046570]|uniref:helix-turn-helix domain-containing protein n=1 Tax=Nonomuraea sp. NPDC046570 TaxID=3155255 RepID=UPI00340948D0